MRGVRQIAMLRFVPVRTFSNVRKVAIRKAAASTEKLTTFTNTSSPKANSIGERPSHSPVAMPATEAENPLSEYAVPRVLDAESLNSPVPFNDFPYCENSSFTPIADGSNQPAKPIHNAVDWTRSFHGLGQQPFSREVAEILLAPVDPEDIEIKPDGLLYLPEIKYRRILNRAFGPGGWGIAPRTETSVANKKVTREYALVCHGRLTSIARGEQDYYGGDEKMITAFEGCRSNALMRCCKDLGIASELWDPKFIRKFKKETCEEVFAEHMVTKKKKKLWKLKVNSFDYPYKAC